MYSCQKCGGIFSKDHNRVYRRRYSDRGRAEAVYACLYTCGECALPPTYEGVERRVSDD